MSDSFLLALPNARRIRLAHNEHRTVGLTVREFIRERKLASGFSCLGELRRSIERGELWTVQLSRPDSSQGRFVAAASFPLLVASVVSVTPRPS
jgi:hypothetical protein